MTDNPRCYKVSRVYFNRPGYRRTIADRLTLEEAQAHCNDPETSSSTCTKAEGKRRTHRYGPWFDCYNKR